jgi:hypothetical protein
MNIFLTVIASTMLSFIGFLVASQQAQAAST